MMSTRCAVTHIPQAHSDAFVAFTITPSSPSCLPHWSDSHGAHCGHGFKEIPYYMHHDAHAACVASESVRATGTVRRGPASDVRQHANLIECCRHAPKEVSALAWAALKLLLQSESVSNLIELYEAARGFLSCLLRGSSSSRIRSLRLAVVLRLFTHTWQPECPCHTGSQNGREAAHGITHRLRR